MVVIVPPFSQTHSGDDGVVPARIGGLVVPIAPGVASRIHPPGGMEHEGCTEEESPEEPGDAHSYSAVGESSQEEPESKEDQDGGIPLADPADHTIFQEIGDELPFECVQLLPWGSDRRPYPMCPPESMGWGMRVSLSIAPLVVHPMDECPEANVGLPGKPTEEGEHPPYRSVRLEGPMGKEAVEAHGDPESHENVQTDGDPEPLPGEEEEGRACSEVEDDEGDDRPRTSSILREHGLEGRRIHCVLLLRKGVMVLQKIEALLW